eukprot:12770575-Alexandrium_andersonii.AAC.1
MLVEAVLTSALRLLVVEGGLGELEQFFVPFDPYWDQQGWGAFGPDQFKGEKGERERHDGRP